MYRELNTVKLLKNEFESCRIHADRMEKALIEIEKMLPLTIDKLSQMDTHQLGITELLTGRFAKLQDAIGEKIFPLVLISVGEDIKGKSFIDRLNLLEKMGYLKDAQHWFSYRAARDAVSHEYPDSPALLVENLNKIINLARELLVYWLELSEKIEKIININSIT